jgi:predicted SAM-dependent methyltransferase
MELLIGCGSNRAKKLSVQGRPEWAGLVTLDYEPRHKPDVVHDLHAPLPFSENEADEIHAYEVLEHVGHQGDYRIFFAQFSDYWRVLKDGGYFLGTVPLPTSVWAWGDPSHTRVIPKESFIFLNQPSYDQVGKTAMSDFRSIYKADFDIVHLQENGEILEFALKAVKPSRIKCT